ncbi:tRNA (adenosine(37)-N6)-threonylcarbamoyltransferase complex ATPase subunit type 1 TsaE [Guyparkeria hydrothermalis]|uniref:tRNA (adenosine(37)-N6)-threonylcarbamoyltransferase complex ATPase subunit type 1 TsaE n=1 Tax=Guyparkeria hydrothermalis TaxID=923 RepID=UPI00202225E7|nr:tRNA (adenosine(37)-N6)-threonylcarbamoyltransferase complex ATPase subunit type 1 TsaE [Guyparkeria hydrothermalis]MCL7744596.1 tRNA (adenosine(37)-N6)-threonylcarbamoyltransferase complex ATPase subunit type 1 TsaE [Guyparkeria hydrothermalis]
MATAENRREAQALEQAAVEDLAARLASLAPPAGILSLRGELGAGKSTFARAFLRSLGVTGTIRSPTYTLIEPYDVDAPTGGPARVLHLDLYRLADPEELDYLGLRDELDEALLLIEWLGQAQGELVADLELSLAGESTQPTCRDVVLQAKTPRGEAWMARLGDI